MRQYVVLKEKSSFNFILEQYSYLVPPVIHVHIIKEAKAQVQKLYLPTILGNQTCKRQGHLHLQMSSQATEPRKKLSTLLFLPVAFLHSSKLGLCYDHWISENAYQQTPSFVAHSSRPLSQGAHPFDGRYSSSLPH